MIVRKCDSSLA